MIAMDWDAFRELKVDRDSLALCIADDIANGLTPPADWVQRYVEARDRVDAALKAMTT